MNVLISDIYEPDFVTPNHPVHIRNAFLLAYPEFQGEFFFRVEDRMNQSTYDFARSNDCSILIRSTGGMSGYIQLAQNNYPQVLTFMPAGANTPGEIFESNGGLNLPCIVIAGGGDPSNPLDEKNENADDVTFIANDPITPETTPDELDLSSFANSAIAGQITEIINKLNCTVWEAVYRAMQTASRNGVWHETDGYGFINVDSAMAYAGIINSDPHIPHIGTTGNILFSNESIDTLTVHCDLVQNATNYITEEQIDGEWVEVTNPVTGIVGSTYSFRYKASMINVYGQLEETSYSNVFTIDLPFPHIGEISVLSYHKSNNIILSHNLITNATLYIFERSNNLGNTWSEIYRGPNNYYIDTIDYSNKPYWYRIKARMEIVNIIPEDSEYSNIITIYKSKAKSIPIAV